MQIREFDERNDYARVTRLFCELQDHARTNDNRVPPGEPIVERYISNLQAKCAAHEGKIFVAESEGEIFGYVCILALVPCAEPADGILNQSEIVDLIVSASARSSGVGRALVNRAESYAVSRGSIWMRVNVFAWNTSAQAMYKRVGFSEYEVTYEKRLT